MREFFLKRGKPGENCVDTDPVTIYAHSLQKDQEDIPTAVMRSHMGWAGMPIRHPDWIISLATRDVGPARYPATQEKCRSFLTPLNPQSRHIGMTGRRWTHAPNPGERR